MSQKDLNSLFQKINEYYERYAVLKGSENIEVELNRIKGDLIISVCKIYFNPNLKYEEITFDTETHSDKIVEKTYDCLEKYAKSSSKTKGIDFAKYVCTSIKNMLVYLKSEENFHKRTGGMKISKNASELMNKVKKQDEVFERFGTKDEAERNEKIAHSLEISEQKVLEMKRLLTLTAVSDEQKSGENEEAFSLIDVAGKNIDYSANDKNLQKERLKAIFDCIQEEWQKETDSELSEILTADILSQFKVKEKMQEGNAEETECAVRFSSALNFDLEKFACKYSFINKTMSVRFFSDSEYELPSQVELAAKFDKTKSAISKKLSRFYKKVATNEKLK